MKLRQLLRLRSKLVSPGAQAREVASIPGDQKCARTVPRTADSLIHRPEQRGFGWGPNTRGGEGPTRKDSRARSNHFEDPSGECVSCLSGVHVYMGVQWFAHIHISQTLHVCHICLHWDGFGGQCSHIWHTWSVWVYIVSVYLTLKKNINSMLSTEPPSFR